MILPDVNLLVYAFRQESAHHADYAAWLNRVVSGYEELALNDLVLSAFVRIVTNPRIYGKPTPATTALHFVDHLTRARRARWLPAGPAPWAVLASLVAGDELIRGNRVPDAYLAAVALTHNARLATRDRGFARYPGLQHFDPAEG